MSDENEKQLTSISSKKHVAFCETYLKTFNATESYMAVYPKSAYNSARMAASRLIAKDNISAYIGERLEEMKMSADEALKLTADIARGDVARIMDVSSMGFNLDMKKAQELGLTKLIKKVKQKTTTIIGKKEGDEDVEIHNLEIELYPADAALERILKVHGKYKDGNLSGTIKLIVEYADSDDNAP